MVKQAKKRKPYAAVNVLRSVKENPFETLQGRRKFETLGRRLGTSNQNVTKARTEAVKRRKHSLLVEYKQAKKANAFIDRRFGEFDDKLTEDEKAILRFQRERLKKARKTNCTLADEPDGRPAELLTHLGNPLTSLDDFKDRLGPADDSSADDGEGIDSEFVDRFHFGGGDGNLGAARSKREVMAEVMAKSKAARVEKRMQKEEDEGFLEKLNMRFSRLREGAAFSGAVRVPREGTQEARAAEGDAGPGYDEARRVFAMEGRAKAADRQLTPAELLEREQARLASLERARRQRMASDGGGGDDLAVGEQAGPQGGYAARRNRKRAPEADGDGLAAARHQHDNSAEAEDDFAVSGSSSDGESGGGSGRGGGSCDLDARRADRAAGDHPLQQSFRAATAKLLLKHGLTPSAQSLRDLEKDGVTAGGLGGGSREGEESGDGSGTEDGSDGDGCEGPAVARELRAAVCMGAKVCGESRGGNSGGAYASDGHPSTSALASGQAGQAHVDRNERVEARKGMLSIGDGKSALAKGAEMSVTGLEDSGEFSDREEEEDAALSLLREAIRIRQGQAQQATTAIRSPARVENASPGERGTQRGEVAHSQEDGSWPVGKLPLEGETETDMGPLDISFTPSVPKSYGDFAAMVRGRTGADAVRVVQRIRAFNAAALQADSKKGLQALYAMVMQFYVDAAGEAPPRRDVAEALAPLVAAMTAEVPLYAATLARARLAAMHERVVAWLQDPEEGSSPWPGARTLLLLRLFMCTFPLSDRRHPVTTPLAALLGLFLGACPIVQPRDVAVGLLLATFLQQIAAAGRRVAPEVTPFCEALLHSAVPPSHRVDESTICAGHLQVCKGWLLHSAALSPDPRPLSVWHVLSRDQRDPYFTTDAFMSAAISTVLGLTDGQRQAFCSAALNALPAAVRPLQHGIRAIMEHGGLSGALLDTCVRLLTAMDEDTTRCVARRKPLVLSVLSKKAPMKLLNPKFEADFVKGKDYDPDRERAEYRQYKRMAAKEQQALKRELTRDAAFMGEVRRQERLADAAKRDKTQKRAIAFLQQQEADFKSGGQGGMNLHKKKKVSR